MNYKKIKTTVLSLGLLVSAIGLASCQNSNPESSSEPSSSKEEVVAVSSISLELKSDELKVGEEKQLTVSVLPINATNKEVSYEVIGDSVSVSDSGLVKGLKEGRATIKAKSKDGEKESSIDVFVSQYANEYTFEAEDASITGCVVTPGEGASSGDVIGQISKGSEIKFTLTSLEEQSVDLKVVTSVVAGDRLNFAKYFTIKVNDTLIKNPDNDLLVASEEYGYFNFGKIIFNNVPLLEGKNTIVLTGVDDVRTNLDKIVVKANKEVKTYSLEIPDGSGESYIYEHTDATLTSGASGYMTVTQESGARNGDALGNCFNNNGAQISYKITVDKAAQATMYVCMALGNPVTDNPFKISLNGIEQEIPFTYNDPSANWHHFVEFKVALLDLLEGENDIVITITGGCGNFDYVKFVSEANIEIKKDVPSITGTEYRFEAEYAELENCSVGSDNNGASHNLHVGGINSSSKILFNITSSCAQNVSLKLAMVIVGEDRLKLASNFTLEVNGTPLTSDDDFTHLGQFGSWNNWGELVIKDVALIEGANQIKLIASSSPMTNVDYISIYADNEVYFSSDGEKTTYRFEGSDATLTKCANVSEDNGASGGSHVGQIGTGSEIKYRISSEKPQFVDMKMVASVVGSDRLPMKVNYKEITVNDYPLFYDENANWTTPSTYGWGAWSGFTIKGIHLDAGVNEINIKFADGAMTNFDYIELSASNKVSLYKEIIGEEYTFEAEEAILTAGKGALKINDEPNASNGKALGNVTNNYGATITFKMNAAEAALTRLYASIAMGSANTDNPFSLTLNGSPISVPTHYEDSEANWAHYKKFELADIDLISGENTLVFTITGGCGNFDCIKILSPVSID